MVRKVQRDWAGNRLKGDTFPLRKQIIISSKDNESAFEVAETLTHECFHAVLWENGYGADKQEMVPESVHTFIYQVEKGWTRFVHDNPEYEEYVREVY